MRSVPAAIRTPQNASRTARQANAAVARSRRPALGTHKLANVATSPKAVVGKRRVRAGRHEDSQEVSQLWCLQALWQAQLLCLRRRTKSPKPVIAIRSPHPELNRGPRPYQVFCSQRCGTHLGPPSETRQIMVWCAHLARASRPRQGWLRSNSHRRKCRFGPVGRPLQLRGARGPRHAGGDSRLPNDANGRACARRA